MRTWTRIAGPLLFLLLWGCENGRHEAPTTGPDLGAEQAGAQEPAGGGDDHADERRDMVRTQLRDRDIRDDRVLEAMARVPRHRFVPAAQRSQAYEDRPLSIGHDQTISQPYIVALMTQLAEVQEGDKVLEIGTGSGYQAAVLAELGAELYTIEIVEPLGKRARELLDELGYDDAHVRIGDGYAGWPEHAPYDAIVVTAAPPEIPAPLKEQLADGGRMVVPVGKVTQELRVLTKTDDGLAEHKSIPVRFVPMTGEAQR
ncbi:MAG: protein-L-isoaspartate(D-aspartate) O-methyltransferase [Myxococcota bacterium]